MSWENDHRYRVASFPDDVQKAHSHSSGHRAELLESRTCGCFCCCSVFPPERIEEWVDEVDGVGQTAQCPTCGIDSVLGDRSGLTISVDLLERMKRHWF